MATARLAAATVRQMLRARMPGREAEVLVQVFDALNTDIATLKAWGDTLVAKLNADAGVTDTNYAGPAV